METTTRAKALEKAVQVHLAMLEIARQAGLSIEDRSTRECHIYLALAGTNPMWNLSFSIQFDTSCSTLISTTEQSQPASKPNVHAILSLCYGRKLVYHLTYDGRHDHWTLEAETDSDDAVSWNPALPFRHDITSGAAVDSAALTADWRDIVAKVISFYRERSQSILPQRATSMPPPPSLPPVLTPE